MHTQAAVAIDAALHAAKLTFMRNDNKKTTQFLSSKRLLLQRISKITPFWNAVTHTVRFDLRDYGMPNKKIIFNFLNPIWAWLLAANKLDPDDLLWTPCKQIDRVSGERVYGGGIQFGKAFNAAYQSCPIGTFAMPFSLHWDGTNANGMYSTPIAIGVANTNRACADAHTCVGYMPKLTGMGKKFQSTNKARDIRHFIRQKCITAILSVLEEGGRRGVRCALHLQDGLCGQYLCIQLVGVG